MYYGATDTFDTLDAGLLSIRDEDEDEGDDAKNAPSRRRANTGSGTYANVLLTINSLRYDTALRDIFYPSKDFSAVTSWPIGEGASFYVRKVRGVSRQVVAKYPRVRSRFLTEDDGVGEASFEDFITELRTLCHAPIRLHPNIIDIEGLGWARNGADDYFSLPVLYLEFAPHGNLSQYLSAQPVAIRQRLKVALEVATGVDALHKCGIAHGDLKFENVLIFEDEAGGQVAKLSDFGHSTSISSGSVRLRGATVPWNPPEWQTKLEPEYMHKPDLYSLGLLIWRLVLDGENPFLLKDMAEVDFIKARDGMVHLACDSTLKCYETFCACNPNASSADILDAYMCYVKRPHAVFFNTLLHNYRDRDIGPVLNAMSLENMYKPIARKKLEAVAKNVNKSAKGHSAMFRTYHTKDQYTQLWDAPMAVRSSLVQYWTSRSADNSLDREEQSHASSQRWRAEIDHFSDGASSEQALHWLDTAAKQGDESSRSVAHRVLRSFRQTSTPDSGKELEYLDWTISAAKSGSSHALRELLDIEHPAYAETLDSFREVDFVQASESTITREKAGWMFSPENVESVISQGRAKMGTACFAERLMFSQRRDSMLHAAAALAVSIESFECILSHVQDFDAKNADDSTALLIACQYGSFGHARMLLESGADPSIKNEFGQIPLHWLASFHSDAQIEYLLDRFSTRGLDLEAVGTNVMSDERIPDLVLKGTALHWAVKSRNVKVVRSLIQRGADPLRNSESGSPLEIAVGNHDWQIVNTILEAVDIDQLESFSRIKGRPFDSLESDLRSNTQADFYALAIRGGNTHRRIIRHGPEYAFAFEQTIRLLTKKLAVKPGLLELMHTLGVGCPDKIEFLLDFIDIGVDELDLPNLVKDAITHVRPHVASLLLNRLRACGSQPTSTFYLELLSGYLQSNAASPAVVEIILPYLKGVNATNEAGHTVFSIALQHRHFEIASGLLLHGAQVNTCIAAHNELSQQPSVTTLHNVLLEDSDFALGPLRYLLEPLHGDKAQVADFIVVPNAQLSAIHIACQLSSEKVFDYVLSKFSSHSYLNATNKNGVAAIHWAAFHGKASYVRKLHEAGANIYAKPTGGVWKGKIAKDLCQTASEWKRHRLASNEAFWEDVNINRMETWRYLQAQHPLKSRRRRYNGRLAIEMAINAIYHGRNRQLKASIDLFPPTVHRSELLEAFLFAACARKEHLSLVENLIASGASVHARSATRRTPLHRATSANNLPAARFLLRAGADVHARDVLGRTCSLEAHIRGFAELESYLKFCGGVVGEYKTLKVNYDAKYLVDGREMVETVTSDVYFLEHPSGDTVEDNNDSESSESKISTWSWNLAPGKEGDILDQALQRNKKWDLADQSRYRATVRSRTFKGVWEAVESTDA